MANETMLATSTLWRYTLENGRRRSIRLSAIEEMTFSPEEQYDSGSRMEANWSVRFSSGHQLVNFTKELGDSLHEAWMKHLEIEANRGR
jgi:hypothetical protein